jgi:hypothetical protein
MADKKISQLPELEVGQLVGNDILPIVDVGAQQTKKITIETLRDDLYFFTNVWEVDSPPNETRGYIEYSGGTITYNPPNNDGIASAFVQGTGVNISKETSGVDSGKYKIQIGQSVGAGDTVSFKNLILKESSNNGNTNYLNITPEEIGANLNNQDSTGFAINNVTEINLKGNGSGGELEITADGITPTGSPENFTISNATLNNVNIGTLSSVNITGGSISGVTLTADSITLTPVSFTNLPTSPAAGTRAFINDAPASSPELGWGDTITVGGGSTTVPVWYDGSNWRVG